MSSQERGIKRRTWKGRSKNGCKLCRARHIKCDEGNPCRNCIQIGKVCPGPGPRESPVKDTVSDYPSVDPGDLMIRAPPTLGPQRDAVEGKMFNGYILERAQSMMGYHDFGYWNAIVPAAQEHDQLFTAVLAVATLYGMPMTETMDPNLPVRPVSSLTRRRYRNAQEWYFQSVSASLKGMPSSALVSVSERPVKDTVLLMLTSVLYIWIELRQANYENLERLIVTTFAVVYSAEQPLRKSKDSAVLASLTRLLDFSFTTSANAANIPELHWRSAIGTAMSLMADLNSPEVLYAQVDLYSLYYDLEVIVQNAEAAYQTQPIHDLDDYDLDNRLMNVRQTLGRLASVPGLRPLPTMHLMRMQILCLICDIHLKACQVWPMDMPQETFKQQISQFLSFYEGVAAFGSSGRPGFRGVLPLYLFEASFAPCCLWAAWHWRDATVAARCTKLLNHFLVYNQDKFLTALITYIQTITSSEDVTPMEIDLFGRKPKELLYWQAYMCVRRLIATSNQLPEPPAAQDLRLSATP